MKIEFEKRNNNLFEIFFKNESADYKSSDHAWIYFFITR